MAKKLENFERMLVFVNKDNINNRVYFTIAIMDDLEEGLKLSKHQDIIEYSTYIDGLNLLNNSSVSLVDRVLTVPPNISKAISYLNSVKKEENVTQGIFGICIFDTSVMFDTEMILTLSEYDIQRINEIRKVDNREGRKMLGELFLEFLYGLNIKCDCGSVIGFGTYLMLCPVCNTSSKIRSL